MRGLSNNVIFRFLKNKSVNNALWLYTLQFFNTIFPLLTLPYVTRILGASQYGLFSIALNFVAYLQVVVEFGFGLSATRKVSATENVDINKVFSEVFISRLLLFVFALVATAMYIFFGKKSVSENMCVVILAVSLVGYCVQVNWLFQGKQDMKYISLTSVIARIITTICIFGFVKKPNDIVLYCCLYSLSPMIANTIGLLIAMYRYGIRLIHVSFKNILDAMQEGLYVFFTQLSSKIFGAIGITFLGIWASDYEVGVYSAINKLPYILILFWGPISQIIYPINSRKLADDFESGVVFVKKLRKYSLLFFGIISVLICLWARQIINIMFGQEYSDFYFLLYPLLIWMLLGINNNFWGIQLLVASGHDKEYANCFQKGVIATILFNLIFIYCFGIYGAALAPFCAELFLGILLKKQIGKLR